MLFGKPAPTPMPMPVAPSVDPNAAAQRQAAADAAVNASRQAGRRSTMVGGMQIAEDDQYARGSAAKAKRSAAASTMLGD